MLGPTRKIDEPNRTRFVARGDRVHLSRRCRHTNRQPTHHQAANQQHHFHRRSKVHDHWHRGFLPKRPHGLIWVHEAETYWHTGWRDWKLQPSQDCNAQHKRLLQDTDTNGHMRASPSGHNCLRTTRRPTEDPWLLPKQNNTRTMEAQIPPHPFLPHRWWLQSKVH